MWLRWPLITTFECLPISFLLVTRAALLFFCRGAALFCTCRAHFFYPLTISWLTAPILSFDCAHWTPCIKRRASALAKRWRSFPIVRLCALRYCPSRWSRLSLVMVYIGLHKTAWPWILHIIALINAYHTKKWAFDAVLAAWCRYHTEKWYQFCGLSQGHSLLLSSLAGPASPYILKKLYLGLKWLLHALGLGTCEFKGICGATGIHLKTLPPNPYPQLGPQKRPYFYPAEVLLIYVGYLCYSLHFLCLAEPPILLKGIRAVQKKRKCLFLWSEIPNRR